MRGGAQKMPSLAKAYIATIAAVATAVLAVVALRWNPENFLRFLLFFTLAMLVLFNAACLTVCTAAAFWVSHSVPPMLGLSSIAAMMVLGACVYLLLNTGLVSLVISLAEGRSLKEIWSSCYEWTFPYFLAGAAVAGLASAASHGTNLGVALLVVPAMYLVYVYYRMHIVRAVLDDISNVSLENEAALVGGSRGR